MKKGLLLCSVMLLALLISACGTKSQTVDVDELTDELLTQVDFEDELTELGGGYDPRPLWCGGCSGTAGVYEQRSYC